MGGRGRCCSAGCSEAWRAGRRRLRSPLLRERRSRYGPQRPFVACVAAGERSLDHQAVGALLCWASLDRLAESELPSRPRPPPRQTLGPLPRRTPISSGAANGSLTAESCSGKLSAMLSDHCLSHKTPQNRAPWSRMTSGSRLHHWLSPPPAPNPRAGIVASTQTHSVPDPTGSPHRLTGTSFTATGANVGTRPTRVAEDSHPRQRSIEE